MESQSKIRMNDFLATMPWRESVHEWHEAFAQCERWKLAHPEAEIAPRVLAVMAYVLGAYALLKPVMGNAALYDRPAPIAVTTQILLMARMVRRELEPVQHIGKEQEQ